MTTAIAGRVVDSSRTLISGVGDNAAYTLVAGDSGKIIIAAAAQDDNDEFRTGNSHSIEYRASGAATFLSLPTSGTAAVPRIDTTNTTLSNDTNVTDGTPTNRRVSTGPSGGQGYLEAGKEFVTSQSLNYGDRCRDDFTECQVAIDFSLCGSGTAWEFRIGWEDDAGATTNGTCPTVTTAAAGGTNHTSTPSDASTGLDSLATTQATTSAPSDDATAVDSQSSAKGQPESPSDAASGVDELAPEVGKVEERSDGASAVDSLAVARATTAAPSDAVSAVGDPDPVRGRVESPSDAASSVDGSTHGLGLGLEDSASAIGDPDPQKTGTPSAAPSDSAEAIDSQSLGLDTGISEAVSATDSLDTARARVESPGEGAGAVDELVPTQGQTEERLDGTSAVDELAVVLDATTSPSDAAEVVDSLDSTRSTTESPSDASSAADGQSLGQVIALSDAASAVGDPDPARLPGGGTGDFERTPADGTAAVDALEPSLARSVEFADAASTVESQDDIRGAVDDNYSREATLAAEALSAAHGNVKIPADAAESSDAQKVQLLKALIEAVSCGDSISIQIGARRQLNDSASTDDLLIASYTAFENIAATDTLTALVTIGLATEILGVGVLTGQSPPELLTEGEALALLDIYNIALNALGVGTLANTSDDNPQRNILNDVWPSFRQQFLTDYSWNGAKKSVALSRLQDHTGTDVTPAGARWSYAYVLPSDYLRVLRINGFERFNKTQSMLQNAFEVEVVNYADTASTTKDTRCLLTDEAGDINLEYIFDPGNDNLELLGSKTTHALGLSLAHYVARNFGKTPQEIQVLSDDARRALTDAKGVDGQEKTQRLRPDMTILESRYWWVG